MRLALRPAAAVVAVVIVAGAFAVRGAAQNPDRYKVRLSTVPMDGGMRATVAGSGTASAVLAGAKLAITGTFQGLRSPATAAQLYQGVKKGVRGMPVADLTISKAMSGTITGSLDLTPAQVRGLQQGQLYIEIASEKAPDGNLWGWLVK